MTQSLTDQITVLLLCRDITSSIYYQGDVRKDDYYEDYIIGAENCGKMSPISDFDDVVKAHERILKYLNSLKGKQRLIKSSQISEELGMSKFFIESILVADGFEEE